ncbi:MAG: biopolymer transporter ExbD [Isosphaeraceae bacterium]
MSGSVSSEVRAEPNLTPLLDIVFQLITFFMMVINFSKDAYDARVRLPVAGSAKPVDASPHDDRLVLNLDRDGRLLVPGEVPQGTEEAINWIKQQARLTRINLEFAGKKLKAGEALPTTLVIRADKGTPYSQFFRIVTACQAEGFQKFALKAMNSEG